QALQARQAAAVIDGALEKLAGALREKAFEHRRTVQVGRTHGVHAEPIVFGLKFALWFDEARRDLKRLREAADDMRVGKISGAVGTFAHFGPEAEARICERLGLRAAPIASQVISRDRHAHFLNVLALIAALCEKIALEVRHLQRTEVREAEEPFGEGQKGSSAMPHKRNPVTSEQICGLARVVRANVQAAYENIALWHERDISHSSVERVIMPDSCILIDYLLAKTCWLVEGMRVNVDRMRRNLDSTRGLIFSGQLLLDLAAAGMLREQAYKLVQSYAMKAWHEEGDFRAAVEADPDIRSSLGGRLDETFSLDRQLRHVDAIYARVFGE
ncbi:MAG TPA: adenylosuccinate lyase, partial [Solibacterales bacterium]|nr:adenylosuccinate lyase [Bryobacterales bacterium]